MHEQRAHKNWHDERQVENIDHKKAPWSAEELALLARQEAQLVLDGVKFINQALLPIFKNRSLESIKGQRKSLRHKERVLQIIQELTEENTVANTMVNIQPELPNRNTFLVSIQDLFRQLKPLNGNQFQPDRLGRICENISIWSKEKVHEELELYLLHILPLKQKQRIKASQSAPERKTSKRQMRRAEYAKIQRAWRKNPCKCLRIILKGKSEATPPAKQDMIQFWRTTMTNGTNTSPENETKQPVINELWSPVTTDEIKQSFPELNTSPGPDGLSSRQMRAIPLHILARVFNLFLICGKLPRHLLKARTTLIPKKDGAQNPEDYRPITVQSVLTRTFHKVLARRLVQFIQLDKRQKAFLPTDGCASNTFDLDMILRYHRQFFKPLYMASIDIAKAFDSVSHDTIRDSLHIKGVPSPMVEYIMDTYSRSSTTLTSNGWESGEIHPTCGVRQGDPLSPILFNIIIDRLLRRIPPEIGVSVENIHFNALIFADDMLFFATTPNGLQIMINTASEFLAKCGLLINATKSFTVALRTVPHMKKSVVDGKAQFLCLGQKLPALKRESEWKYLGVPFTPEGRTLTKPEEQLQGALDKLTKAPLKPQQRLFALRVMVLPGLYHLLTLGSTTLSRLKKIDALTRAAARKWLDLPHDVTNAYFHANVNDGGLSIPSMRWLMPLHRKVRLQNFIGVGQTTNSYLTQELQRATKRLTENRVDYDSSESLEKRWAILLHGSIDGKGLRESRKTPQQHHWVTDGSKFLSGRDFVNATKLRINAMPTRSRTARGRRRNRLCRGGCNAVETLNHVLQQCHRTHRTRIERHNAIINYVKRALVKKCERVEEEPLFVTAEGNRKPDLIAIQQDKAIVLDAQIVSEHIDLDTAHTNKVEKYQPLNEAIKDRYVVNDVSYYTATLSYRGVWSAKSSKGLFDIGILKKKELKIIATRVLVGGLNAFWRFNKTTNVRHNILPRTGVG